MRNLTIHWKISLLHIFADILKKCEEIEDYENCIKIKANIDYLASFLGAPNQAEFPYPFEQIEDDESVFIRFLPNSTMTDYIEELDKLDFNIKPKRKRKK